MNPEQLFSLLNMVAIAAWIALIVLPRPRSIATVVPMMVSSLLSVIYVVVVASFFSYSRFSHSSANGSARDTCVRDVL